MNDAFHSSTDCVLLLYRRSTFWFGFSVINSFFLVSPLVP